IECKNTLRAIVVDDSVRVAARFGFAGYFQCIQIKYNHLAVRASADKALPYIGRQRNPVDTVGVGNLADNRSVVDVNHHNSISSRDVKSASRAIHGQVVPSPWAAQLILGYLVEALGRACRIDDRTAA